MRVPRFADLTLQVRFIVSIGLAFIPITGLLAAGILFAYLPLHSTLENVVHGATQDIRAIDNLQNAFQRTASSVYYYLLDGDPVERQRFARLSGEMDNAFEQALAAPFAVDDEDAVVPLAKAEWEYARALGEALVALPHPAGDTTVTPDFKRFDAHMLRAVDLLDQIKSAARRDMGQRVAQARAFERRRMLIFGIVYLLAVAMTVGVGVTLIRSVLLPISRLSAAASHFAKGDFSYRISWPGRDEFARLARAFNGMAQKLEQDWAALEEVSIRDSLTGLYNRRAFDGRLKDEVERSRRYGRSCSLLLLDIDRFKVINDTCGHQAGDEVLCAVAAHIAREARTTDYVARYGGEEFAVILSETPVAGAVAIAERIRKAIAVDTIVVANGQRIKITASVGAAVFPSDAETEDRLVAAVDHALYAAKNAGRNKVYRFDET